MMEAKLRIGISNNVVIYGFQEEESELANQVSALFENLGLEKPTSEKVLNVNRDERLGKAKDGALRPTRLKLNAEMKKELMKRKKLFNDIQIYNKRVWINHDKTSSQRHEKFLLREAERRFMNRGGSFTIENGGQGTTENGEMMVNGHSGLLTDIKAV